MRRRCLLALFPGLIATPALAFSEQPASDELASAIRGRSQRFSSDGGSDPTQCPFCGCPVFGAPDHGEQGPLPG